MELRKQVPVLAVALTAVSAVAWSQQPAPASAVDALLAEVRLLRMALERQAPLQTRAQLLVGRLALQDQRVARARAELQRASVEHADLARERAHLRDLLKDLEEALETADASRRPDLEREVRSLEARQRQVDAGLAAASERRAWASEAEQSEQARYDDLERWFADLDRQLEERR
jgi:chromosome segregation ATPase